MKAGKADWTAVGALGLVAVAACWVGAALGADVSRATEEGRAAAEANWTVSSMQDVLVAELLWRRDHGDYATDAPGERSAVGRLRAGGLLAAHDPMTAAATPGGPWRVERGAGGRGVAVALDVRDAGTCKVVASLLPNRLACRPGTGPGSAGTLVMGPT